MRTNILKLVAIFCCMFLCIQAIAQEGAGSSSPIVPPPNVILPSPQSQAFEKYINHAITEYNGLPDITIPLYEMEIKGLKIPVCLNYHASGIQYRQNDGEIGAGWTLSVGGYRITRRINGKCDFTHEYYSIDSLNMYRGNQYDLDRYLEQIKLKKHKAPPSLPIFEGMAEKYIDGEYDLFTYMTPSTNGNFIITERDITNHTYVAKHLEHRLDTILFSADNNLFSFHAMVGELSDENGFKYYFGGSDDDSNFGLEGYWASDDGFVTGWPLRTIQSPYGETVQFDYEQYYCKSPRPDAVETNSLTITEAYCRTPSIPAGHPQPGLSPMAARSWGSISASRNTTWAQFVKSIIGVKEDIEFIREKKDSSTNTGCLLKEIHIKSKDGQTIKKITLEQDMLFTTGTTIEMNGTEPWHYVLKTIKIGDATTIEKEYRFDYYKPSGIGASPDYWNYYVFGRKATDQRLFIPIGLKDKEINAGLVYQNTCSFDRMTMSEGYADWRKDFIDRSVDVENQKSFSLKRITFPTGGYTEYEYESNRLQTDNMGAGAAGQRVKKITSCTNPDDSAVITVFEYEQGVGVDMYDEYFLIDQSHTSIVGGMLPGERYKLTNHAKIFSTNNSLGNIPADAFNVRYSKVITLLFDENGQTANNGKTVSIYDVKSNYLRDGTYLSHYNASGKPLLINRKVYDVRDTLIQEDVYEYELTGTEAYNNMYVDRYHYFHNGKDDCPTPRNPTENDINTYPYWNVDFGQYAGFYLYKNYNISTGRYLPASKTTILYSSNGNVKKREDYTYNNRYQLIKTGESASQGGVWEKEIEYLADVSPIAKDKNLYSLIHQEITKNNGQEIKRIRNNYPANLSSSLPLPESVDFSSTGVNGFMREADYRYDQRGNLIQYTDRSGIPVSFLWGYDEQYPIVQAVGATYDQLIDSLNDLQVINLPNYKSYTQLNSIFSTLRTRLKNVAHITGYTYQPLVGVTSEVGPDGLSTYYRYDKFGRLRRVLDHNLNVVKQYRYHYASQVDDADADKYDAEMLTIPWWVETGTTRCQQISMAAGETGNSGLVEHEYIDENPSSTSYNTKKWKVKSTQVNPSSCPATYKGAWRVIDNNAYFVQPHRSYNDERNMKYTVTVYYQLEPIPGQPAPAIYQQTKTAYPFRGKTGTEGIDIMIDLGEQNRYHSHTVSITQE